MKFKVLVENKIVIVVLLFSLLAPVPGQEPATHFRSSFRSRFMTDSLTVYYRPMFGRAAENPVLPLLNRSMRLEYAAPDLYGYNQYLHNMQVIPDNPFYLDVRGASTYVPRMVRDELNLIMNRPRETAFVPVLGVAFIAMQLAQKYVFIQRKTSITAQDIVSAAPAIDVLQKLWAIAPQTATQLYESDTLYLTIGQIEQHIQVLVDNKLIRQKVVDGKQPLYYPAVTEKEMEITLRTVVDSDTSGSDRAEYLRLLRKFERSGTKLK